MITHSVGADLHKESIFWTVINADKKIVWSGKSRTTEEAIKETLHAFPCRPEECRVVFEPVSQWSWFADILHEHGADTRLANSLEIGLIAKGRKKNDKVDSKILAELLHSGFLPTSYIAPKDVREMREIIRWRTRLVRVRTMLKNRIHSILHKHGIIQPNSDLFGKKGLAWLEKASETMNEKDQILSLLRVMQTVDQELTMINRIIRRASQSGITALLKTIPGVGDVTALTIMAEVGDFSRFPTPDKLSSYAGLVPSSRSSGSTVRQGLITKQGSRLLRYAMVQAVQRVNPSWGRLWEFYRNVSAHSGFKRAKVALARKLLVISWHIATKREPFRLEVHASGGVKR